MRLLRVSLCFLVPFNRLLALVFGRLALFQLILQQCAGICGRIEFIILGQWGVVLRRLPPQAFQLRMQFGNLAILPFDVLFRPVPVLFVLFLAFRLLLVLCSRFSCGLCFRRTFHPIIRQSLWIGDRCGFNGLLCLAHL